MGVRTDARALRTGRTRHGSNRGVVVNSAPERCEGITEAKQPQYPPTAYRVSISVGVAGRWRY